MDLIRVERAFGIAWEGPVQQAAMESRVLMEAANAVNVYGHLAGDHVALKVLRCSAPRGGRLLPAA